VSLADLFSALEGPETLSGTMEPGSASSFGPSWFTPPSAAAVGPWGWIPLDAEHELAWIVDTRIHLANGAPLFARLTYRGALEVAARDGAHLIHADQVAELQQKGIQVSPVFLPDASIRAAASGILARRAGETPEAWDQRLRTAGMTSLAWALHHDGVFWSRLGTWPAGALVAGAGKHWVMGAPEGRAWLMGWWSGGKFVQGAPPPGAAGFHDDSHHDYATTTILVRRRDGSPMPAPSGGGGVQLAGMGGGPGGGWLVAGLALAVGATVAGWYLSQNWPEIRRRIG
jgi:hypothetical protein